MGAGLAGSMTKGVNVNQVQFGDKLQGLAPQATHFFIAGNGRAGWNQYRTRTNGDKRNFVFCMNQLGGVGASRSQFKIRGLNKPDGTGNCLAGPYSLKDKIEYLRRYFLGLFPGYTLCLVGEHELIRTDLEGCPCMDGIVLPESGDPFIHLMNTVSQQDMVNVSPQQQKVLMQAFSNSLVRNMVTYMNSQCSYIRREGCVMDDLGTHTLGLVPDGAEAVLHACGYGDGPKWHGLGVYGMTSCCSLPFTGNGQNFCGDDSDRDEMCYTAATQSDGQVIHTRDDSVCNVDTPLYNRCGSVEDHTSKNFCNADNIWCALKWKNEMIHLCKNGVARWCKR